MLVYAEQSKDGSHAVLCLQAHLLDGSEDRPRRRGLHFAETGLPPCQDYNSQMAAEGRDGPAGQGAVRAHQEAGHGPAGREGKERPGQRGALRNSNTNATGIKAVQHVQTLDFCISLTARTQRPASCTVFTVVLASRLLTEAFCTAVFLLLYIWNKVAHASIIRLL